MMRGFEYLILSLLTMRTIREMVKTELDLEDEVADSAGFKSQVKEIVEKKMCVKQFLSVGK